MSALHSHIQDQQLRAMHLQHILEAAEILTVEGLAPGAVISLVATAHSMACELNAALDCVALPEGGDA